MTIVDKAIWKVTDLLHQIIRQHVVCFAAAVETFSFSRTYDKTKVNVLTSASEI